MDDFRHLALLYASEFDQTGGASIVDCMTSSTPHATWDGPASDLLADALDYGMPLRLSIDQSQGNRLIVTALLTVTWSNGYWVLAATRLTALLDGGMPGLTDGQLALFGVRPAFVSGHWFFGTNDRPAAKNLCTRLLAWTVLSQRSSRFEHFVGTVPAGQGFHPCDRCFGSACTAASPWTGLAHSQRHIAVGCEEGCVDSAMAPLLETLWTLGIRTRFSCEAEPIDDGTRNCQTASYIAFASSEDLERTLTLLSAAGSSDGARRPDMTLNFGDVGEVSLDIDTEEHVIRFASSALSRISDALTSHACGNHLASETSHARRPA